MTVSEAVDELVGHTDNVGPSDASNAERRLRYVEALNAVVAHVAMERDWPWRLDSASLTAVNGSAALPVNYGDMPRSGMVLAADGRQLEFVEPHVVINARAQGSQCRDIYSVFGQMDTSDGDGLDVLQIVPTETTALTVFYGKAIPLLDEADNNELLSFIPARWHRPVILPGARAFGRYALGDGRAAPSFTQDADYLAGLRSMIRAERPTSKAGRQLGSFFGGYR